MQIPANCSRVFGLWDSSVKSKFLCTICSSFKLSWIKGIVTGQLSFITNKGVGYAELSCKINGFVSLFVSFTWKSLNKLRMLHWILPARTGSFHLTKFLNLLWISLSRLTACVWYISCFISSAIWRTPGVSGPAPVQRVFLWELLFLGVDVCLLIKPLTVSWLDWYGVNVNPSQCCVISVVTRLIWVFPTRIEVINSLPI